jgi:hypothetical protein
MKITARGALPMHSHSAPDSCLQVELQQVIMPHTIIATVEVDEVSTQHSTMRVPPIREVEPSANKLLPNARVEVKSKDIAIAIDTTPAYDVHQIIFDHRLMAVAPTWQVSHGNN